MNSASTTDGFVIVRPSLRLWYIYLFAFLTILIVKGTYFEVIPFAEALWKIAVLSGAIVIGYQYLQRATSRYVLSPIELVGYTGVFSRRVTRLPLNRITNYDFRASFLERLVGIGDVMVDTPGGAEFELRIRELNREDATAITEGLRDLLARQKIAEAGDDKDLREIRRRAALSASPVAS